MSVPNDFSNSAVLLSSAHELDEILRLAKNIKFTLPSYMILVGLKNYDCKYDGTCEAKVVKCKNGRSALRFVKNLRGTVLGVVVGENINDMNTPSFLEKISKLLLSRVIFREEDCSDMFINKVS